MQYKYTLKRKIYATTAILGVLYDEYNKEVARSLENPWINNKTGISCIPEGAYKVVRDNSGKFQFFKILNAPNRDFIEIHQGNWAQNTKGCILLGKEWCFMKPPRKNEVELSVNYSNRTIEELDEILPDEFELTIERADY